MTKRQVILIALIISLFTSCRHGYKVENDEVYYEYWNEGSGQGKRLIEQADAATFQTIEFDCDCSFTFGKDKNHLFIDGELIKGIDPNTFKYIGNYIFSDKERAYFFGFYNDLNDCEIKGVDPNRIELIEYPWAKADNILIHGQDTIYLDDITDFIPIDKDWGKTKRKIINENKILFGADIATFKVMSSFEAEDKNHKYQFGFIHSNEFKKTNIKSFNFNKSNICSYGPLEFYGIYDDYETFDIDSGFRTEIVERLKTNGYTITSIRQSNSGESKIISTNLTSNNCDCYVEKFYKFDYSQPFDTGKVFKVTERIYCNKKVNFNRK
jgi:hypothetical protein